MTIVLARNVKPGDYVINGRGERIKVLASYKDGYGPSAVWCIEGYAEGRPTARIRGGPEQSIELAPAKTEAAW